jgi:hypothetical protein
MSGNLAIPARICSIALPSAFRSMYLASNQLPVPSIQLSVTYRPLGFFRGALWNLQLRWFPAILPCAPPQLFFRLES